MDHGGQSYDGFNYKNDIWETLLWTQDAGQMEAEEIKTERLVKSRENRCLEANNFVSFRWSLHLPNTEKEDITEQEKALGKEECI